MSKIFKASNVIVDGDNKFIIETPDIDFYSMGLDNSYEEQEGGISNFNEDEFQEDIVDVSDEAERIIEEAQIKAQSILDEAQLQANTIKEDAFAQGHKEGYDNGYDVATKEAEVIKQEAEVIKQEAKKESDRLINEAEPFVVDLMVKILDKLLSKSAKINKQLIINLIKQGLQETTISGDVIIRVSADDYDTVIENKEDILSIISGGHDLEIVKDLSLMASDCILETPLGNIDCSLDQQFDELKQNIYYILENR